MDPGSSSATTMFRWLLAQQDTSTITRLRHVQQFPRQHARRLGTIVSPALKTQMFLFSDGDPALFLTAELAPRMTSRLLTVYGRTPCLRRPHRQPPTWWLALQPLPISRYQDREFSEISLARTISCVVHSRVTRIGARSIPRSLSSPLKVLHLVLPSARERLLQF